MDVTPHKALVVGINLTPEEMADAARVVRFFKRELIPYVDTNYPTLADASHRAVAAQGTGYLLRRSQPIGHGQFFKQVSRLALAQYKISAVG